MCIRCFSASPQYFNPRSPRGGATGGAECPCAEIAISIHAPHEGERRVSLMTARISQCVFQSTLPTRGSDVIDALGAISNETISIHAPHEGERLFALYIALAKLQFQSTLPTRGSDEHFIRYIAKIIYFNPRSPRGGATLPVSSALRVPQRISIHAPHEGERLAYTHHIQHNQQFQSTLPTRGSD